MYKKDGVIYTSEEEYMRIRAEEKPEPKRRTTKERVWLVIAVIILLIVLFFVLSLYSEYAPKFPV